MRRLRNLAGVGPNGGMVVTPRHFNYYDTKLQVFRVFKINTFQDDDFPVDIEIFAREASAFRGQPFPGPGDPFKDGLLFSRLLSNFITIHEGLSRQFPLQFWPSASFKNAPLTFLSAFVGSSRGPDDTVHFTRRYFNDEEVDDDSRAVTLAHERAHTLLRADGHPGSGDSPMCVSPHLGDPLVLTPEQALMNAYCYEWLTYALQPSYNPARHAGIECDNSP